LVASIIYLSQKPTIFKSVLIGLILGINILCKAIFLPFIIIIPLLLTYLPDRNKTSWKQASIIIITSLFVVFPWTLRNYNLTGKFIPVHLLGGFNLALGDGVVENYSKAPFSFATLWRMGFEEKIKPLEGNFPKNIQRWEKEFLTDSMLIDESFGKYIQNPLFLLKKLALNSFLFWTLGENKKKTIVISLMQIPLLLLFILAVIKLFKNNIFITIYSLPIFLVLIYYMLHLPIVAIARYSIILIPTIIIYASSIIVDIVERRGPWGQYICPD
jgi:hypothetical protein